jgi:hypothetical protein
LSWSRSSSSLSRPSNRSIGGSATSDLDVIVWWWERKRGSEKRSGGGDRIYSACAPKGCGVSHLCTTRVVGPSFFLDQASPGRNGGINRCLRACPWAALNIVPAHPKTSCGQPVGPVLSAPRLAQWSVGYQMRP